MTLGRNFGWGLSITLSLWKTVYSGWAMSDVSSPTHHANVMAARNDTFIDICFSEHVAKGLNGGLMMVLMTKLRSHGIMGSRISRYTFCIPVMKHFTVGCAKSDLSSMWL